ncbi:MAG: hypothetical protein ACK41T_00725 [Pseudobdellovibrio sp.]
MTKMLHELITLAKEGKKFSVTDPVEKYTVYQNEFSNPDYDWNSKYITTPWTDYKEVIEPMVLWVNVYPTYNECYDLRETAEHHANDAAIKKAVKFVEVVE